MTRNAVKRRDSRVVNVLAIIQPDSVERERLRECADAELWNVKFCDSVAQAIESLHAGPTYAAVVLDGNVPGVEWESAIPDLAARAGPARILLASQEVWDGLWERVVEHGGHDVLVKPLRLEQIRRAVLHAYWYSTTMQ